MRHFISALALISCLGPLQSATLERLSLEDMIGKSTSIVRGKVTGSYTAQHGGMIYTHYRLRVDERWKGPGELDVEFVVPGGTFAGVRQQVDGAPALITGKPYMLFLWSSGNGLNRIIGFTQGLFELPPDSSGNVLAVRPATSETMLEPGTGRRVRDERIEMRLRDLSTRISADLAKGGRK